MINKISSVLEGVKTAAIAGHVRPDGDCVGSCMGMYLYLKKHYPQIQVDVYLEEIRDVFSYIEGIDQIKHEWQEGKKYDLLLLFARNPGVALYRKTIYERVWHEEFPYGSKTVDLHIQRLRKMVGWENRLRAVNKVGYRLEV